MSDERRDEVIARALGALPIPEHGPTFWDDLDRRMGDPIEPAAARAVAARVTEDGVHRLDTSELPTVTALAERRSRRSRRAPVLAVAAAVVVLAIAAGFVVSLAAGGDDDGTNLADRPTDEATTTVLSPESATTGAATVTSTGNATGLDTPSGAVTAWLQAIASGDTATATDLTGPITVNYAATAMDGIDTYLTEQQASFAALAELPDSDVSVIPETFFQGASPNKVSVVIVNATDAGAAHADGPAIEVFPVVDAGQGWKVEPLAFDPSVADSKVIVQSPRVASGQNGLGSMDADAAVEVIVPAAGTVVFKIDGLDPFARATTGVGANDDPYARYDPQGSLSGGTHTLVVVGVGTDGTIVSTAGPFTVTGGTATTATTTGDDAGRGTTSTSTTTR